MNVSQENLENCQVILTVEAEPEEIVEALDSTYQRLVTIVDVPGFRRGKAPRPVLENYFGRQKFREEALDSLTSQLCEQVVHEREVEAISQPEIETLQTEPLIFKVSLSLPPVVELGDYHNIKVAPLSVEVAEEEIEVIIEGIRQQYTLWNPVERPVNFGDLVSLEVETSGDKIEGEISQIEIDGSPNPLPGFAEQLIGMDRGEEREFSLAYPEDYAMKKLAGKQYQFKVKTTEIKEKEMPELNDDFARSLGGEINSLAELRGRITTNLRMKREREAQSNLEQKVISEVVKVSKVAFPPILVEREIDYLLDRQAGMFNQTVADYLRIFNRSEEKAREELRPKATERVTYNLIVGKIAEEEKIEVAEEEIDTEIERVLEFAQEREKERMREIFSHPVGRDNIKEDLRRGKAVDYLVKTVQANFNAEINAEEKPEEEEVEDDS
jgi:trigger factor